MANVKNGPRLQSPPPSTTQPPKAGARAAASAAASKGAPPWWPSAQNGDAGAATKPGLEVKVASPHLPGAKPTAKPPAPRGALPRQRTNRATANAGAKPTSSEPQDEFSTDDPRDHYTIPIKSSDTQLATANHEVSAAWEKPVGTPNLGGSAIDKLQTAGDVLNAAGLRHDLHNDAFDTTGAENGPAKFAGRRTGVTGSSQLSVGAGGVTGNFERQALTGLYAQNAGQLAGRYGTASYEASAKLEAGAKLSADGKLNLNGLNLNASAGAGVTAEATFTGNLTSKPVKLAGVPVTAGLEATGRLSATAGVEANGQVQLTRYPPAAIIQGSAGASAVAKADGTFTAHLGPVGVTGHGYVSAGAEAKASGVAGYQDGMVRFGVSAGAAAGVGMGGGFEVDVNAAQITQGLKHAATAASRYNCFGDPSKYVLD